MSIRYSGKLNLSENKIEGLPSDVGAWVHLEQFAAAQNGLVSLPSEVHPGVCGQPRRVPMWPSAVRSSSRQVAPKVRSSKVLSLWFSARQVRAWTKLNHFDASANMLRELPAHLAAWTELKILAAKKNRIVNIPEDIGALRKLQRLELTAVRSSPPYSS